MSNAPVRNMPFNEEYTGVNGPVAIDRRSKPTNLTELSAGFVTFTEDGATDPWTLPYEEAFYVIEGALTLVVGEERITGVAGEVLTLEKGVTAIYEGTAGTRAFFSLVPADWMERSES
ncbi:hypothetical protein EFK50_12055 [Nocardioides marmoriginsengisoli]|uniref:DUF861 domain-containing protein n=1 Tax=Nocardioides marmoriginsengisoli TaxID=661483 RepID=A0A3N0CGC7_9ACTN|nr:hypothetical protein [Nocardioides marmoriginsengisoli]RNL62497.1 hypothetical protein EFK50_12055 [Nocardioides marmoriginsengisoli]